MLNTSREFKIQSREYRNFYVTANCTLSDGTVIPMQKKDFYLSGNGIVDSSDSAEFPLGLAIEKTATLSLVNDTDKFSDYNFNRARFVIFLNLLLPSGRVETIKKGTFIVSQKPTTGSRINLTLLDHMYLTDKKYSTNLLFPATIREILQDSCLSCGIALGDARFPNDDYIVQEKPENTTHRAVIGFCAMLAGGNARIDSDDYLRIMTFSKQIQQTVLDGGLFSPWTAGTRVNGGSFKPWTTGDHIDGGQFGDRNNLHIFSAFTNLSYDTDDVEVTGVKTVIDETEYLYGEEGYVLNIQNPLITGNEETALQLIGEKVIGLIMRPFSLQNTANPTIEFMDLCAFPDIKGKMFFSYITDVDFLFSGYTNVSNRTKSLEENASEFYSLNAATIEQAKRNTEKRISAYDVAVRHMNQLAANTLGFFYTEIITENGNIIAYRHDKPELSESKVVYKNGIDGFFVTQEYTGNDATTPWKAGFDKNGDAVLNILYAIGIQSEWINTRGLTAKDNAGNITFRVGADAGDVEIVASKFSLSGKSIGDIAQEQAASEVNDFVTAIYSPAIANLQAQIDGQIETWYYDHEPALSNIPASGWKTEADRAKHEGDLFYWKSKGYSYRFFKDGNAWKWQIITDSDITKALADASKAQDTADHKRRVFVTTPAPPYDVGDLWFAGGNSDIMTCMTARTGGSYSSSDWKKMNKYIDQAAADNAAKNAVEGQTQTDILNRLTNNGADKGIYLLGNKLYISFSAAKGGELTLGGANNGNGILKVLDASGTEIGTWDKDGIHLKKGEINGPTITVGGNGNTAGIINVLNSSGYKSMEITSNGLKFYDGTRDTFGRAQLYGTSDGFSIEVLSGSSNAIFYVNLTKDGQFDVGAGKICLHGGTGEVQLPQKVYSYATPQSTAGWGATFEEEGSSFNGSHYNFRLYRGTSSSKRYKDIGRDMSFEDIQELYNITPVWAKYKEGYLRETDERCGKEHPMFIAEDVEKYAPLAVDHNKEGQAENWNYRVMIPYMFQMLKEQHKEIEMLKSLLQKENVDKEG